MTLCALIGLWCTLSGQAFVIDGDTLIIKEQHIRLWGIDAEELNERHGVDARNALIQLVGSEIVTCEDQGQKSYDRIVAKCYILIRQTADTKIGMDLGWAMVKKGYALDCARYSKGMYRAAEPDGIRTKLKQKPYC